MDRAAACDADPRYVGDPVDVITGAVVERALDVRVDGSLPILWHRHYSSARRDQDRGVGWGHRHGLDHILRRTVDGLCHEAPAGETTHFSLVDPGGKPSRRHGWTLHRPDLMTWRLSRPDAGAWTFILGDGAVEARPTAWHQGDLTLALNHVHGQLTGFTDADGRRITVERDAHGRIVALRSAGRALVTYGYDAHGNLTHVTDRYGGTVRLAWHARGLLKQRIERTGYTWEYTYDAAGRCTHAGGRDGVQSVALAWRPGRTEVTRGDGGVWAYHHDAHGLVRIVDPYGAMRRFERDASGRLLREIDARGVSTWMLYDAAGGVWGRWPDWPSRDAMASGGTVLPRHPAGWEHGEGVVLRPSPVQRVRDAAGLRVRELLTGNARSWRYDANGNVVRFTDLEGATWRHGYASANHRVLTMDPLGQVTHRRFDVQEALVSLVDPGGTQHGVVRDLRGDVVEVWQDGLLHARMDRDAAGDVVALRDASGTPRVVWHRRPRARVITRTLASGDTQTLFHDTSGRLIRAESQVGTQEVAWDAMGHRVVDERNGLGVRHRYDAAGLAETWVLNRFATTYVRRPDGGCDVTDPAGGRHRIHQPSPGVVVRQLACGWTERARHDHRGRCLEKLVSPTRAPERAWRRRWTWSPEGDLVSAWDDRVGHTRYVHDRAHRLVSVGHPDGTVDAYAYDAAGNLVRAPAMGCATVEAGNRLRTAGTAWFEWDRLGRLRARHEPQGITRYAWDARDQLAAVSGPGVHVTMTHDVEGRRCGKSMTGTGETTFWWDRDRLAAARTPDGLLSVYVYPDAGALTPMLCVVYPGMDADPASGHTFAFHGDHLGSPVALRDASGTVIWAARLTPYGAATVLVGEGVHQPLRFPGHYADTETGLHDNRYRSYCPRLGRYLQPDPVGLRGGVNLYAYTANPLRQVDLRGLRCPETESHAPAMEPEPDDDPGEPEALPLAPGLAATTEPRRYGSFEGLDGQVFRILTSSPRMADAMHGLWIRLWTISMVGSEASELTHTCRATPRIVVRRGDGARPQALMAELAHEVGHAISPDPNDPAGRPANDTEPTGATDPQLRDEARATLFGAEVRQQILDQGGPDIGIAGARSDRYQAVYEAMQSGALSQDTAERRVMELFRSQERVGGTGERVPYDDFYTRNRLEQPGAGEAAADAAGP